jgi:hypothetical protein
LHSTANRVPDPIEHGPDLTNGGKVRFSATTDRPVKAASVSSAAVALMLSKTTYAVSVENSPASITAGRYKDGASNESAISELGLGEHR